MSNYNSALTLCLSLVKMYTNTDDKQSLFLFVLFLFCTFPPLIISYSIGNIDLSSDDYFDDKGIAPCVPCDTSIHHTLRALNRTKDIDKTSNEDCYHKGILSLLMNHFNDELDIAVSIMKPYKNKNEWCSFKVYWNNQIQATLLLNQNTSIISSNSSWSIHQNPGSSKLWLIKKTSTVNSYSGTRKLHFYKYVFGKITNFHAI